MLIKRILILTEDGLPLFDFIDYSRGDEALVSGLIAALLRFAEETEKETISRVMLQESQYILTKMNTLIFVFQVSDEMPGEYAEHIIDIISKAFIKDFSKEVESFVGNVSVFYKFQETCKELLNETGIGFSNLLSSQKKDKNPLAWGIFSPKGSPLVVNTNDINYNIDSFAIFHLLGKSLRKVVNGVYKVNTGVCHHISHTGNIVQTILLPYVHITIENKFLHLTIDNVKKFKIMTSNQITEFLSDNLNPAKIQIIGRKKTIDQNEETNESHANILDMFEASSKGFSYLYNSPPFVQIITTNEASNIVYNLPNRKVILDFEKNIKSEEIMLEIRRIISKL